MIKNDLLKEIKRAWLMCNNCRWMLKPPGQTSVDTSTPAQPSAASEDVEILRPPRTLRRLKSHSSTTPSQEPEGHSTALNKDQLPEKRGREGEGERERERDPRYH